MNSQFLEEKFNENIELSSKKYTFVIVGAGLGGLTAANEVANAGSDALVVEFQKEGYASIRPQLINLAEASPYLEKLYQRSPGDVDDKADSIFLKKLDDSQYEHFGIKDIQRYLKRRINKGFCTFAYESRISSIDMEEGCLLISKVDDPTQQEKIYFEHLIIADGANSHTVDLIKEHIEYQPIQERPEVHHAIGYFKASSKDNKLIEIDFLAQKLAAILVDGEYCGMIYPEESSLQKSGQTQVKFCVVMHVSPERFKEFESNRTLGINYLKHCASSVFNEGQYTIVMTESQNKEYGKKKDKLKFATFCLGFTEVKTPAFIYKGHKITILGEARRDSDIYQGHGGNDAIMDGALIGRLLRKEIQLSQYNEDCRSRSKKRSDVTKYYQPLISNVDLNEPNHFAVPPFVNDVSTNAFSLESTSTLSSTNTHRSLKQALSSAAKNIHGIFSHTSSKPEESYQALTDPEKVVIHQKSRMSNCCVLL